MRKAFASLIVMLTAALCVCVFFARRSGKKNSRRVAALIASLIPPMIGNLLIIATEDHLVADIGSYMYFIGMDLIMYFLIRFTVSYCGITSPNKTLMSLACAILLIDAVQILCNLFFDHAFSHEIITYDGGYYFRLIPHLGQTLHRAVIYGILFVIIGIFTSKTIRSPRVDAERYAVILLAMIVTALWETFYIFSRTPIDRSMIGFGVFGLLVFYFALYYRPVRLLNRMMASIVGEMEEALFFFDTSGKCIWINNPGTELTGLPSGAGTVEKLTGLFGDLSEEGHWSRKSVIKTGKETRYYILEKRPVQDYRNRNAGFFLRIRDDTEEQRERSRERYLATHDSLTGLYNREFLCGQIRRRLKERKDIRWLVVFVDIKNFKIVNDVFGNEFGDLVLRRVAEWVARDMSANTIYGRLVGDTFGALIPADEFDPERIEKALSNFIIRQGSVEYAVQVHVGVYEITDLNPDVTVMFDRARIALTTIQDNYQRHIAWYDEKMRSQVVWNQQLSGQLTDAISRRQIIPYLQPMTDRNGRVLGAEVLARWNHPDFGFLSPASFIPVFEENGMIAQLDRCMWRGASEILAVWKDTHPKLFLSVNISPKDFYYMDVVAELRKIVREYRIEPDRLRLEITETVMMTDEERHAQIISDLRSEGFLVEMDDFGSGYSSLNMLKDTPVDVLKIDMKFLSGSGDQRKARRILKGIINMCDDLGLESVTEGVETEEQHRMLSEMGCHIFQGYYIARPMDHESFEKYLGSAGPGNPET